MRVLNLQEMQSVSAGHNLAKLARDACKGLPNSANVTVTETANGSVGFDATNAGASTSKSTTINCGDMSRVPSGRPAGGGSGGARSGQTIGPFVRRENK